MKQAKIIAMVFKRGILVILALFFLNGFSFYPIAKEKLELNFLTQVQENGLSKGKVSYQKEKGNSRTLLFINEKGEKACATYVKSLYSNKWKQVKFYTSNMGVFREDEIKYTVNDLYTVYDVTCHITEEPAILFGEDTSVVLWVKVFGICVGLMAACVGVLIGKRIHNS